MMMMCSLSHRQRHLEDLATDIEKFHVLVQQLSDHKAALLKKVQDNSTILKEKEEKLEKKEVRLSQLHDLIVHQEYSMEDIHNLECDKANLEEKIRQVGKAKESKENSTLKKAMDLKNLFDNLHLIVDKFNSKIQTLFKEEIDISHNTISIQKPLAHEQDQSILLGGVDLKGKLVPWWSKQKNDYIEKISQLRRDLFDLADKKEASDEDVSDINREIEVSYLYFGNEVFLKQFFH